MGLNKRYFWKPIQTNYHDLMMMNVYKDYFSAKILLKSIMTCQKLCRQETKPTCEISEGEKSRKIIWPDWD